MIKSRVSQQKPGFLYDIWRANRVIIGTIGLSPADLHWNYCTKKPGFQGKEQHHDQRPF